MCALTSGSRPADHKPPFLREKVQERTLLAVLENGNLSWVSGPGYWKAFLRCDPAALLREFSVVLPPVPIQKIVEGLGISTEFVQRAGWKGAMRTSAARAQIWLDRDESIAVQRMTLAHELGHVLLHPIGSEFRDISFAGNNQEREAHSFAAGLMMPLGFIRELGPRTSFDPNLLGEIFGVPLDDMRGRLDTYLSTRARLGGAA